MAASTGDQLSAVLERLSGLAGPQDRATVEDLQARLRDRRLRVLVAGEAKRGKSTLVNALLGRAVLPSGVIPLTALATAVRYGVPEGVSAAFSDGRAEELPLSELDSLVTERGNPANVRGLASVTVKLGAQLLSRGVELVDTPGTGSVYAHNTTEAETVLNTMDAAVVVLTADPPVSASERELISMVAGLSVRMFVVLNKADYLGTATQPDGPGPGDLAEALEFTATVAADAAGHPVQVYPVSARAALSGAGDPGFAAFESAFASYLDEHQTADLHLAIAGHARRLARSMLDEADLTRRAARMRDGEAAGRVQAFGGRLEAVATRRQDAVALAQAASARLLGDLNSAAERAAVEGTARAGAGLATLFDRDLQSASAAELDRDGQARLSEVAVRIAEDWRQQRAAQLEAGLARLDARLTTDLQAELDAVRGAAAELLGLSLSVPASSDRLAADLGFFYVAAGQAGQSELLAGVIRRRLPGETGRRHAREHLRRTAADLVPQHVGRARADLQYRLAEATRRLIREIEARYSEGTRRLENALRTAAAQPQSTAEEAADQDTAMVRRQEALTAVLAHLDQVVSDATAEPADVRASRR